MLPSKRLLFLPLVLLLAGTAAWAFRLTVFEANLEGRAARLEWGLLTESGLSGFDLYRKSTSEAAFVRLSSLTPTGQRRYKYLDSKLQPEAVGPYTYRLTVRTSAGQRHYHTVLHPPTNTMQRSWSSIKSMFR